MNILIDFTPITLQKCGMGVYALNLLRKLHEIDRANTYYVIAQDDDRTIDFISKQNFNLIRVRSSIFRRFIFRLLLEQVYIPYLTLKYRIDKVHSLHYSFPIVSFCKRAVTIPDTTVIKFPRLHTFIRKSYFRSFLYLSSILADDIITISNSSLEDYSAKFKYARRKLSAIYLGPDEKFNDVSSKREIGSVKNKYNIKNEYILYLGTLEPRKNIDKLVKAFGRFVKDNRDCQLVIAGRKGWGYDSLYRLVSELKLSENVVFTGFVDQEEKRYLMKGAKIFVYPSIYEGFGIPVLEAMSCGIPTITSNVSSLPEIAGDAAVLIDPDNVEELYLGIKILFSDRTLYLRLKERSLVQSAKFSWDKCARETISVYNS